MSVLPQSSLARGSGQQLDVAFETSLKNGVISKKEPLGKGAQEVLSVELDF